MTYSSKISLYMFSIIFALFSCIPKEDPPEAILNLYLEKNLPEILNENSGMTVDEDIFWFINDSGNDSVLYGYDISTNEVTRQIAVKGSVNTDWEALTQNNEYLFIGDFGNNAGNRRDLRIYMIAKSQLHAAVDTVRHSGIIYFNYEDQTDFSPTELNSTKFDCEAFIATNDSIILFAKDWENSQTCLYKIPIQPGNHTANLRVQWNVNGLITDACLFHEDNELYLVGYNLAPFLWVYSEFNKETLQFSEKKRTDFSLLGTQTEGIWVTTDGTVYISSEKSYSPASLFTVRESR